MFWGENIFVDIGVTAAKVTHKQCAEEYMIEFTIIPITIESCGYYTTLSAEVTFDYTPKHPGHGMEPDYEGSVNISAIKAGCDLLGVLSFAHIRAIEAEILSNIQEGL